MFWWVHIKFLYNSKFDLTAKSLITNSVVITRVLCTLFSIASAPLSPLLNCKINLPVYKDNYSKLY